MKKFKNISKIRIKGLNQERSLTKISKQHKIFNLNRIEKSTTELEVKTAELKSVKNQFVSEGLQVEVLSNYGVINFFKNFLKNYGVIAALAISFVLYLLQFNIIWQIKINGTESLNDTEISSFVKDNFNLKKSTLNTKQVEIELKENFKKISSVSVAVVGQSLVINILESVLPSEMNDKFSPIISEVDCKITEIKLIQGTLAVKTGQIVRKGDILVFPFIVDAQGQTRAVNPSANIKAEVWLTGESQHSESYYKTYRTGKKLENDIITLNGLEIYTNIHEINFETYEKEECETFLTEDNILPLVLHKTTYYETKTQLVEQSFEEVKQQKEEEAKQNALIYFSEYDIIKDENVVVSSHDGEHKISYIITVERNIGEQNDITNAES